MKRERKTAFLVISIIIISLSYVPFVKADILPTGFKSISIENKITNIGDYPDYWFIVAQDNNISSAPCRIQIVEETGIIPNIYKFCDAAIYAIPKTLFKDREALNSKIEQVMDDRSEANEFLSNPEIKKVITDIEVYATIPITSSTDSKTNYYSIDLGQIKKGYDSRETQRNGIQYLYWGIAIIGISGIIVYAVYRFKCRKK